MKFGMAIFPTEKTIRIDELARELEARGFESMFVPEHTHIPASRRTPSASGQPLPGYYSQTFDPFIGLAIAAAATRTLKVGTGICLVVERDPIVTAKEVATLDVLSGGRFIFGVGAGWNAEEMENHGTAFKTRRALMRERIEAMKAIWRDEEAQYHGKFVNFDPIWLGPKPTQKPHPPILMGGHAKAALRAVIDYCDGWMPTSQLGDVFPVLAELRRMAQEKGRDPRTIAITTFYAPTGEMDRDRAMMAKFKEAGVERVLSWLPSDTREAVLPKADAFEKLARAV